MAWRASQGEVRTRTLAKFDAAEAERWASFVVAPEVEEAYLADLARVFSFRPGMAVLDVGAGTGAFCGVLARVPGLALTAMEPAPPMLAKLDLEGVAKVEGFCDAPEDRRHFADGTFDVIAARQVANGLYDPLVAFRNWHAWLRPGGAVVVIEGLFDRAAWAGKWAEEVDELPLSACLTTATLPYLLEAAGFEVTAVERMAAVDALSTTGVTRYVVVAKKPVGRDPMLDRATGT